MAEHLVRGELLADRIHPIGYPELVAALLRVVGNKVERGAPTTVTITSR